MYNIEEIFDEIDQIENVNVLKRIEKEIKDSQLTETFWKQRKLASKAAKKLAQERAKLKCQVIAKKYGASIPLKKNIRRFRAPYGFFGIQISPYASIGKNCTIFPNAVIGANTFLDSKAHGFPTIEDNVFIGAGAMIIGNVTIGENARIGANAVVTKDVPANCVVVAGEPRILRKDELMDNTFISAKQYRDMFKDTEETEKEMDDLAEMDDFDDIDDFDDAELAAADRE